MLKEFRKISILWLLLSTLTGLAYPTLVTGLAQALFPFQANGSLIEHEGSILLGQSFIGDTYFWGRSTRVALSPSDPILVSTVKEQISRLHKSDSERRIPINFVSASASRVDPDISPEAAYYQVSRVAKARRLPRNKIEELIQKRIQKRTMGLLGEPRVNVFLLNRDLDNLRV